MKAMAEKLRKWIKRRIGGYTREETAKKYPLPKAMRDVLSGKAPGACTSVEFLKVDFLTEGTEQPEKEDAPTVDTGEIRAKVRELGNDEPTEGMT